MLKKKLYNLLINNNNEMFLRVTPCRKENAFRSLAGSYCLHTQDQAVK